MAPSPQRHAVSMLLLVSLFLLSVILSHAAKEAAVTTRRNGELQEQKHHQLDEEATMSFTARGELCGGAGGGGEVENEECLMRRTLVAHTDYIYTQDGHN